VIKHHKRNINSSFLRKIKYLNVTSYLKVNKTVARNKGIVIPQDKPATTPIAGIRNIRIQARD
jgi:hypothetical protein